MDTTELKRRKDLEEENKIRLVFIQPGKQMQNACIERCNGSIQRELLNAYVFRTLTEVRQKTGEWMLDYNHHRPHQAMNFRTPVVLLEEISNGGFSFYYAQFSGELTNH